MGKFTDQQRKLLVSNKNIEKVTSSNVQFTVKFKLSSLKEFESGRSAEEIFESAGIDLSLFKPGYAGKSVSRWRKAYSEQGKDAFTREHRGKNSSGRPKSRNSFKNDAEELAYLRAENEFLKKLHALGKSYQKNKGSR